MNVVVKHWCNRGDLTSHVIQVFILTFFIDTVSVTQNLKNVRPVHRAQLTMVVERMASVALATCLTSK